VIQHKDLIFSRYTGRQQECLDFILAQYVRQGVDGLDRSKILQLIEIRYLSISEGMAQLGDTIAQVFTDFQAHLYGQDVA